MGQAAMRKRSAEVAQRMGVAAGGGSASPCRVPSNA